MSVGYKLKGVFFVLLASLAWGFMPIFTKILYNQGWTTNSVLFFRYFLALLILTIYILYKKLSFRISLKQYLYVLLIGIPGYIGTSYLLFLSYHYASVGLSTMLHFIYPMLVMFIMILFYNEKFNWLRGIAILLTFLGLILLVGLHAEPLIVTGISLALLSGLTYAFYVTGLSKTILKSISPFILSFYFILHSVVLVLIPILIKKDFIVNISTSSAISVLFISLFSTAIAVIAFIEGVKRIGPSNAAMLNTMEPIVSVIAGILIFNEAFTLQISLGCISIVLAIFIITYNIK